MRFETRARPGHRHSEIDLRHSPPHQTTRSSVEEEEGAHPPDPSHCREGEGEGGRGRGRREGYQHMVDGHSERDALTLLNIVSLEVLGGR